MLAFIDPESRIPANHPLRTIKQFADAALAELSPQFDGVYAADGTGRPSIPPERLLKASLLMSLFSVRSERAFCEALDYDLRFRWFLDMDLVEPSFDHSTFTRNRDRLLDAHVSRQFFDEVVLQADRLDLLSDEHFTVDGTLIEAAASLKSFRPKDEPPTDAGSSGGNPANRWVDFHGEKRSNATHQSRTDPDARLYKKGAGQAAKLCYVGHAVMENRHGLLVDFLVTTASGTAECAVVPSVMDGLRQRRFHPETVGLDKGYDTRDLVAKLRARDITPHVAQNTTGRRSAIDGRTTRHVGYAISQRIRMQVEIVCSQLTKTRVRAGVGRGYDVPNLHRIVGYDHSVDQQLYQFTPLFEGSLLESAG
jgi:transposase